MILYPLNGKIIRKCVYHRSSEQLIKFVAILKPDVCIISEEHKYGVPIVSTINCCYAFWRTTQQQKTAQSWDLARLLIDQYSIIFEILGFRHSTVFILVFNGLTVKTPINLIQKKKKGATCKLVGIKWCEIYKRLVCNVMVPMGTELNNVINNYKSEIHFFFVLKSI